MADPETFARAVQTLARCLLRVGRERAKADEVTPQQAETLQLIAEKGSVSTSLLATILGIDPSTASRNLAGMERAGYLTRKKDAEDARQTEARLTPRGKRLAESIAAETAQCLTTILERLPRPDRPRVAEALILLGGAIEAEYPTVD